jgi:hypothetical protein
MDDADRAYAAAVEKIAAAKASGATDLDLHDVLLGAPERIPDEISSLTGLTWLNLWRTGFNDLAMLAGLTALTELNISHTAVSDLSPVNALTGLVHLYLSDTGVKDLSPVAELTGLTELNLSRTAVVDLGPVAALTGLSMLYLSGTGVTDLSPIAGLTGLSRLDISDTGIMDLRPLRGLRNLAEAPEFDGLTFKGTNATRADARVAEIAAIRNRQKRARTLFDYLDSLEPAATDRSGTAWISLPPGRAAPIEAAVSADGLVVLAVAKQGLGADADADADVRARAGWEALREFHDDVAETLGVANLPSLTRAIAAFGRALGTRPEDMRPIALGTHGLRIVAVAREAGVLLVEEKAADLTAFAGAITLHLQRFPDWVAYLRDLPLSEGPPLTTAAAHLRDVAGALALDPGISPEVAARFVDLVEAAEDAELAETEIKAGVLGSLSNILSAAAKGALRRVGQVAKDVGGEAYKHGTKATGVGLAGAAGGSALATFDVVFNKGQVLMALAQQYPGWLGWLEAVLRALGR